MSMSEISTEQISRAVSLLSAERMSVYTRMTGDERDAILLHDQMLRTGAALMPVTGLIEICLRNSISEQLRSMFGTVEWLQEPPPPFEWRGQEIDAIRKAKRHAQRAEYTKKNQHQKRRLDVVAFPDGLPPGLSHQSRVNARQRTIEITVGQLTAQLTLNFWKRLLSEDYQATLWDRALKRIFPDKAINRAKIAENLEVIYQSRNRIAHHEPLYGPRLDAAVAAIEFLASNFGPKNDDGLTLLQKMIDPHFRALRSEKDALAQSISKFVIQNSSK